MTGFEITQGKLTWLLNFSPQQGATQQTLPEDECQNQPPTLQATAGIYKMSAHEKMGSERLARKWMFWLRAKWSGSPKVHPTQKKFNKMVFSGDSPERRVCSLYKNNHCDPQLSIWKCNTNYSHTKLKNKQNKKTLIFWLNISFCCPGPKSQPVFRNPSNPEVTWP